MSGGATAKQGGIDGGALIEHMKASVQPSSQPAKSDGRALRGSAGAGLRGGYMDMDGAAVPPANSFSTTSSSTTAQQTRENLERALRMNEATNNSGYATMQSLGKQREVIQNSLNTVGLTHQHLGDSRQVIRDIRMGVYKEWLIKGCVIVFLLLLIVTIFYFKFIRK